MPSVSCAWPDRTPNAVSPIQWVMLPPDHSTHPIEILLVEDNPSDLELTLRAFTVHQLTNTIHVVRDGVEALEFLFREGAERNRTTPDPDLILLDLNLPRVSGKEVLARVRSDARIETAVQ